MPAEVLSCNLDRTPSELATIKAGVGAGKYTLRYILITDVISGPLNLILSAYGATPNPLPSLWSTYSYQGDTDSSSYAKTYKVDRDPKNNTLYYVTVTYEPAEDGEVPDGGGDPIKSEPVPINRAPVFWWDREVTTRVEPTDGSGATVRNYANNLYEELIEHERARGQLVVEFNVATQAEVVDFSRTYDQAVNSSTFTFKTRSLPPRTVMVREISGSAAIEEGTYTFYTISMRLAFADLNRTWDVPMPEMSQTHFTKTSGVYDLDQGGFIKRTDAGSLVPLNADGTRRSDTQTILVTNWRMRREVDFGPLQAIFNRT